MLLPFQRIGADFGPGLLCDSQTHLLLRRLNRLNLSFVDRLHLTLVRIEDIVAEHGELKHVLSEGDLFTFRT